MCRPFPTCEPAETVMQRVAAEIGSVAEELAGLEQAVAALVAVVCPDDGIERLQAFDRLNQQLQVLKAFLVATGRCGCGRIDLEPALEGVWLEAVRKRLGGGRTSEPVSSEPELW